MMQDVINWESAPAGFGSIVYIPAIADGEDLGKAGEAEKAAACICNLQP